METLFERRRPLLGPSPDYSKAIYPDVPSHDFLTWLVMAEMNRRHHKCRHPLRVRFLFQDGMLGKFDYGPFGLLSGQAYPGSNSVPYSNAMVTHVLRPAIEMMGAINEPDLHAPVYAKDIAEYCEYDNHQWQLVDAARAGHEVPRYEAPTWAHREVAEFLGRDVPVVITLRETDVQPQRNANVDAWFEAARQINERYPVIVLRDTAKLHFPVPKGMRGWPRACSNAYVRAALYAAAFCNLSTSSGPPAFCLYGRAPYILFKQLIPTLPGWAHGQPSGWREQAHLEVGDQYPWAGPDQRITWTDDTVENIMEEFERFAASRPRLPKREAAACQ